MFLLRKVQRQVVRHEAVLKACARQADLTMRPLRGASRGADTVVLEGMDVVHSVTR